MKTLWNYWKTIIKESNKDKITDNNINLFIPVNTYWSNSIWRTNFVIIPKWKLSNFKFNITSTCSPIISLNWQQTNLNTKIWWNISFNYKINKSRDYAFIKFYNPNLSDWNILYSAWYATNTNKNWTIINTKYYKPLIMRIWFLKNTKTYNITKTRSPFNYWWDNDSIWLWFWFWITNWINKFIYKYWKNWDSNANSIISKSNKDILNWATYNWRSITNGVVNTQWISNWNLNDFYPTSYYNRSNNWFSIVDSTSNWLHEVNR